MSRSGIQAKCLNQEWQLSWLLVEAASPCAPAEPDQRAIPVSSWDVVHSTAASLTGLGKWKNKQAHMSPWPGRALTSLSQLAIKGRFLQQWCSVCKIYRHGTNPSQPYLFLMVLPPTQLCAILLCTTLWMLGAGSARWLTALPPAPGPFRLRDEY